MNKTALRLDLILLLAAIIWGFAFVAQRIGMDYVGPFTYNGVRFALGAIVLLPFLFNSASKDEPLVKANHPSDRGKILIGSLMTGLLLFGGVALQQLGLQQTSAGKAGLSPVFMWCLFRLLDCFLATGRILPSGSGRFCRLPGSIFSA